MTWFTRRLILVLISIPLAVIIITFAVTNRHDVAVILDPFKLFDPAFDISLPLYSIVFITFFIGLLIGALSMWLNQHFWRRLARQEKREIRDLKQQNKQQQSMLEEASSLENNAPKTSII